MRVIHGTITLLAALAVLAFGATWVLHRYDIGPDLGIWQPDRGSSDYISRVSEFGAVPIAGPAKLLIPVESPTFADFGGRSRRSNVVLPVRIGSPEFSFGMGFNQATASNGWQLAQGGSCGEPTVNVLKLAEDGKSARPIFDRRLMIARYAYFEHENGEKKLLAMIVAKDTNEDGYYSCLDAARVFIISFVDDSTKTIDRTFAPSDLSRLDFDGEDRQFHFIERQYADDMVHQAIVTISFDGEIVSETKLPDMLSDAHKAFDKTSPSD